MELVWQTNAWEDYLYWQDADKKLTIAPVSGKAAGVRTFNIQLLPQGTTKQVRYEGKAVAISF